MPGKRSANELAWDADSAMSKRPKPDSDFDLVTAAAQYSAATDQDMSMEWEPTTSTSSNATNEMHEKTFGDPEQEAMVAGSSLQNVENVRVSTQPADLQEVIKSVINTNENAMENSEENKIGEVKEEEMKVKEKKTKTKKKNHEHHNSSKMRFHRQVTYVDGKIDGYGYYSIY